MVMGEVVVGVDGSQDSFAALKLAAKLLLASCQASRVESAGSAAKVSRKFRLM